jgi:hypothetical protein
MTCSICGKKFLRNANVQIYCSDKCYKTGSNNKRREKNALLGKSLNSWTDNQDKDLKALYSNTPTSELERKLGHSRDSIYNRAKLFKLKKAVDPYNFSRNMASLYYLAGIIDGEGCISISKGTINHRQQSIRIRVANTNFELIDWLHTQFGGKTNYIKKKGNRRPQKMWSVLARKAAILLREIQPYLIVKREQAKIALLFQETVVWPNPGLQTLSPEVVAKREQYRRQIVVLNTRGNQQLILKYSKP